jgi:hypothetical protein
VPAIKKGVTMKKKWTVSYPNIPSAIHPMSHGERLPIPEPPENFSLDADGGDKNNEHQLRLHSKEQQSSTSRDPEFCPSLDSSQPYKITETELNNLIRVLELPKKKAELLASGLQQWNLLDHAESDNFSYPK